MIAKAAKILTVTALLATLALVPSAAAQALPEVDTASPCYERPAVAEVQCYVFVFIGKTLNRVQEECEKLSADCNVTRIINLW